MRKLRNTQTGAGILILLAILLCMPTAARAGNLEPSAPPTTGTMHSLEDIYQLLSTKLSSMEARLATLEEKVGPRFADNNNGTITDKRIGLIWLKNANPCGKKNWNDAVLYCNSLANGVSGLTDGSVAGQWRLPSIAELQGIGTDPPVMWDFNEPPIPWTMPGVIQNIPINVQSDNYWSSITCPGGEPTAMAFNIRYGGASCYSSSGHSFYLLPVRNGN
ncbi:MAG: DUF1566 domain-containing protein [Pseudomonadota bacterium]